MFVYSFPWHIFNNKICYLKKKNIQDSNAIRMCILDDIKFLSLWFTIKFFFPNVYNKCSAHMYAYMPHQSTIWLINVVKLSISFKIYNSSWIWNEINLHKRSVWASHLTTYISILHTLVLHSGDYSITNWLFYYWNIVLIRRQLWFMNSTRIIRDKAFTILFYFKKEKKNRVEKEREEEKKIFLDCFKTVWCYNLYYCKFDYFFLVYSTMYSFIVQIIKMHNRSVVTSNIWN